MGRTTLIVPGLHGSLAGHWQNWWLQDHADTYLVHQADWSAPDAEQWLHHLEAAVAAHPGSLIIAHSLGSILTARLAGSPLAPLVAGALLVAPADINRTSTVHRRSYEFGIMPGATLPFPSVVVASRDDVYMPFDKAVALAEAWGSGLHDLGFAGHVNIPSGYGRWPAGYELAARLSSRARLH
jgi:predicted alpha/beta hydrolase family esterase